MKNTQEILEDMRKITMLTGEISKIHQENLKTWPYVIFNEINSVEIKYDLTKDYTKEVGEGYIEFRMESGSDQDSIDTRCNALAAWVRNMFWNEIKIIIYNNNKKIYENSSLGDINGLE